jgi:hypothetical protein
VAEWTKGPWRQAARGGDTTIVAANGTSIGWSYGSRDEEPRANAALIAAAPELAEAQRQSVEVLERLEWSVSSANGPTCPVCRESHHDWPSGGGHYLHCTLRLALIAARAALAKAKGETR